MKDIVIKAKQVRKEIYVWLIILGVTYLGNIYAIIKYKTQWSELVSSIKYVIIISLVLYFILAVLRGLIFLVRKLVTKKRTSIAG